MGLFDFSMYGSALVVALLGSGHCFGMCGGIAAMVGIKKAPSYHLGRGIGYGSIGAISGSVGQGLFQSLSAHPEWMIVMMVVFLSVFFFQGYLMWNGSLDSSWMTGVQRGLYGRFVQKYAVRAARSENGWIYGLTSVLIPCGWILYFGWMAAATGSPISGSILFLMLWLGSLPALLAATGAWSVFRSRFRGIAARRVMASAIFFLSLASIAHRMSSIDHKMSSGDASKETLCGPKPLAKTLH